MVPIHDTDLAEERWLQGEWKNYELWEKVVARQKKRRKNLIFFAVFIFLALSSIPILGEQWPKWKTRSLSRKLAHKMSELKQRAVVSHKAYQIEFSSLSLDFRVFEKVSCFSKKGKEVERGRLGGKEDFKQFIVIGTYLGQELKIPGLSNTFCYDPLAGSRYVQNDDLIQGFGIIPVKDLAQKRIDRVTILLLRGVSGEMSFD